MGEGVRRARINFPLANVGSPTGGDNRKRARSAQRREGSKARGPALGSPVRAIFPECVPGMMMKLVVMPL